MELSALAVRKKPLIWSRLRAKPDPSKCNVKSNEKNSPVVASVGESAVPLKCCSVWRIVKMME